MLFGEGVPIAGCLILHMLGQRHRFELFDFCSHVFSVHVADSGGPSEPALLAFIHRVSMMKKAHDQYAAMLEARDLEDVLYGSG